MENLKALVYGRDLTTYQKGLALQEFEKGQKALEIYECLPSDEEVQKAAADHEKKVSCGNKLIDANAYADFIAGAEWLMSLIKK